MSTNADDAMLEGFREWKAMGEGGVEPTWEGYLANLNAEKTVAFEDTLTPSIYQDPEKYAQGWAKASAAQRSAAQRSFLDKPLPVRSEPRSRAKRFVFPQREKNADDHLDPHIRETYQAAYHNLGQQNTQDTEWKTSVLEKHGQALFMNSSFPLTPLASPTQREICHIHNSDMSGHVTLSFADAQEAIAKGWGERHRLSGTSWLHLGYTMVYVPRNVDEIEVMRTIFQAGVDYMRSG